MVMVKVEQFLYWSGQTLRVPGGSRQLAHEGDMFVSPKHWLPLPPPQEIFLVLGLKKS